MTREELYSNAAFLALVCSETTSTVMAVVVYMIGTHPDVKAKLLQEVLAYPRAVSHRYRGFRASELLL